MSAIKIVDLLKDEKPYDLEDADFILITGITESNLNDAIRVAESARESGVGNDIESAIRKAAEMYGDIHGAKRAVYIFSLT